MSTANFVARFVDASWLVWPALLIIVAIGTALYRRHLASIKRPSSWGLYFLSGQAQVLNGFLIVGTAIPALVSLVGPPSSSISHGGSVTALSTTQARYVSDYIDTADVEDVTLFARVDAAQTEHQKATVIVYGLRGSQPEGEIVRFDATKDWTVCRRKLTSGQIRIVVDFPGGEASVPATTTDAKAASTPKPKVELTLYCAPKATPPAGASHR